MSSRVKFYRDKKNKKKHWPEVEFNCHLKREGGQGRQKRFRVQTFGSMGLIYRPLSSENITFFALPAFPRRLCACCAK